MTSYYEAQQRKFIKQVATMYPVAEEFLLRAIPLGSLSDLIRVGRMAQLGLPEDIIIEVMQSVREDTETIFWRLLKYEH